MAQNSSTPIVLDARTATDHFPGIGRYVVGLTRALTRLEPSPNLALLHDPAVTTARWALPDAPRIPCALSPFSFRQQLVVPRLLRQARAALYHSPYYLMPYRPGVPTVLTCYDLIPHIFPEYFSPTQVLVYRVAHLLALRTAQTILAISQTTKADLVRLFRIDPARIVVTPLAAEARFAPQPQQAIDLVRRRYGLPEKYVLYLGSNKLHKNLPTLFQAWRQVRTDAALVIAGAWDARYQIDPATSDSQSAIKFIHNVDDADLPALYSGATLFVFPSLYEGFGLPPLEAMACGAPVVCSNASALPEVVGDAALLFDPRDAEVLAAQIARVMDDAGLREELRAKSLARAAQFSWERTARETWRVYEDELRR